MFDGVCCVREAGSSNSSPQQYSSQTSSLPSILPFAEGQFDWIELLPADTCPDTWSRRNYTLLLMTFT